MGRAFTPPQILTALSHTNQSTPLLEFFPVGQAYNHNRDFNH